MLIFYHHHDNLGMRMAVSTISNDEKPFSTALIYFLGVLGIALVVFFGGELIKNFTGMGSKSALEVKVASGDAQVLLNNEVIGNTPFESKNIKPGTNTVAIRNESRQYQTEIKFLPSKKDIIYNVSIDRDLGVSDVFSSGRELWFDKDGSENTLRVVSEPSGADVYVDGSKIGTTPFSSAAISNGDYTLKIIHPGYESSETTINMQKDYTLNVSVKLFPYPVDPVVKMFEDSANLYNITSDNFVVTSDTQSWVKGVIYWNTTRGINIDDVGMNKEKIFDYFIDYKGGVYDGDGNPVSQQEDFARLKDLEKGAYLGITTPGGGITPEAKAALEKLSSMGVEAAKSETAKVIATPLGWLRVRETPSLNGAELTKVNTGETYSILGKETGWVKIKVSDTVEGWVSDAYVELSK